MVYSEPTLKKEGTFPDCLPTDSTDSLRGLDMEGSNAVIKGTHLSKIGLMNSPLHDAKRGRNQEEF